MDKVTQLQDLHLLQQFASLTDEERANVIDTGCFNKIIAAYMVATLKDMKQPTETIQQALETLYAILDEQTATEALQLLDKWQTY